MSNMLGRINYAPIVAIMGMVLTLGVLVLHVFCDLPLGEMLRELVRGVFAVSTIYGALQLFDWIWSKWE